MFEHLIEGFHLGYDAEIRLIILRLLNEERPTGTLASSQIEKRLRVFGCTKGRDYVHKQIRALQNMGAVDYTEAATVFVTTIRHDGIRHLKKEAVLDGVEEPTFAID